MDPTLIQQLLEAVAPLLKVEVMGALTVAPMVLQWLKVIPGFKAEWAALAAPVVAVACVFIGRPPDCPWDCYLLQSLLAWIWIDMTYRFVVEPMARSKNPLFPNK